MAFLIHSCLNLIFILLNKSEHFYSHLKKIICGVIYLFIYRVRAGITMLISILSYFLISALTLQQRNYFFLICLLLKTFLKLQISPFLISFCYAGLLLLLSVKA